MMNWKKSAVVLGLAGSMFLTLFACSSSSSSNGGGGASCPTTKACPNDPDPDTASCQKSLNDPNCGSQNAALGQCAAANEKCGADGKTDSNNLLSACGSQFSAALQCGLAHPPADGGTD